MPATTLYGITGGRRLPKLPKLPDNQTACFYLFTGIALVIAGVNAMQKRNKNGVWS